MDDLRGKIALITGGSRGIGHAIAIALADAGADVAINYLSQEQGRKTFVDRSSDEETRDEEVRLWLQ